MSEMVLVKNPRRFGRDAAARLRAAGTRVGSYLQVPAELYEAVWKDVPDRRAVEGPKRWAALHKRAIAWDPATGDPEAEMDFIRKLADGLGLCSCKRDWDEYLRQFPPDLSSAEGYFAWAWEAHQSLNEKLKKTGLTLDEARAMWSGS